MVDVTEETLIGYVTDVQSGNISASLINDEPNLSHRLLLQVINWAHH